jgi:hypothetical protein
VRAALRASARCESLVLLSALAISVGVFMG